MMVRARHRATPTLYMLRGETIYIKLLGRAPVTAILAEQERLL